MEISFPGLIFALYKSINIIITIIIIIIIIIISKFLAQDNDFPAFWLVP